MRCAKEMITNNIIEKMEQILNQEQLQMLQNVITLTLHKYSISEESYELQKYDDYDKFLCEQYYSALKIEGKSQQTIKRYISQIKLMLSHIQKPIREIRSEDLRFYLAKYQLEHGVSGTTLDGMRRCIAAFFSWLEYSDYIEKSPARRIKQIKNDTIPEKALDEGELEKAMLNCRSVRDKAIISFMYDTAARVSEIAKVDISDIDINRRTVRLHGKGGKDRISLFTEKSALYIREYLEQRTDQDTWLFKSKKKSCRVTKESLETMVRKVGIRAGIDRLHPHRFRVTRITHLINRGMPLQDVQDLAGHSSINTTRGYYRNDIENIMHSYRRASS